MKDFEKIIREKGLPDVGQEVRNKKNGTVWRVMEKRETWRSRREDPEPKSPAEITPFISLSGWFSWEWSRGAGQNHGISLWPG
jgi:hypothetical protein